MQALAQWDVQKGDFLIPGREADAPGLDDRKGPLPHGRGSDLVDELKELYEITCLEPESKGQRTDSGAVVDYARAVIEAYRERRQSVDDRIAAAAEHWELSRMSPVDRNAMRVAVAEMLLGETPAKVAMDEAIEIAREYGGEESPRFVNGVLDLVYQRLSGSPKD